MAIRASVIANFLGEKLHGLDRGIIKPCSLNNCCNGGLVFLKKFDVQTLNTIAEHNEITAIVVPEYDGKITCSYIISDNPRLDFARVLQMFFVAKKVSKVAETAKLGEGVKLGNGVIIGEYSVIGNQVTIGDNTEIRHHVVIGDNTLVGKDCLIKSNTVIGEEGFGFERDEARVPIRIPHLGRVIIGDNVEIGASTVIVKGTLDDTIIRDNVKIDDQVFVAHNVFINENSMIVANAEISGSVQIGANCWIGPNSSVMNGIVIGDNVFVGLGAVVTKSFEDNVVVAGNPARVLRRKD